MLSAGFSYVEILLSIVLVGVLLVPALESLRTAITGTAAIAAGPSASGLQSKMEQVVAAPFSKLYAETYVTGGNTTTSVSSTFSDASGAAQRRLVVIYRYDALLRTLAITDTGLVFVSVYYEAEGSGNALSTLVGRWW
jgi:hypothetical protein